MLRIEKISDPDRRPKLRARAERDLAALDVGLSRGANWRTIANSVRDADLNEESHRMALHDEDDDCRFDHDREFMGFYSTQHHSTSIPPELDYDGAMDLWYDTYDYQY